MHKFNKRIQINYSSKLNVEDDNGKKKRQNTKGKQNKSPKARKITHLKQNT